MTHTFSASIASAALLLAFAQPSAAAPPMEGEAPAKPTETEETVAAFGFDLEVDPTAYVLEGYSLHAGLGWQHFRLDLGAFALDAPEFLHGNPGFDVSFDGFGAKLQWFPWDVRSGAFFGVDAAVALLEVELASGGPSAEQTQLTAGFNGGWRFDLPYGLYATPWVGVAYTFGADDIVLAGKSFESNAVVVFPAVHLGYRFD